MPDKFEWNLGDDNASFKTKSLSATVETRMPYRGLTKIEFEALPIEADILQVSADPPAPKAGETVIDEYARGNDLIVTYAQTPARSARPQLYWRILEQFSGVEVHLALQTSLLESDPSMRVFSRLTDKDSAVLVADADLSFSEIQVSSKATKIEEVGLFIFRPLGAEYSYIEMVYPTDFIGAEVGDDDGAYVRYELIPESLEKGVIRKARVRGIFANRDDDEAVAKSAYEDLAAALPPLTT